MGTTRSVGWSRGLAASEAMESSNLRGKAAARRVRDALKHPNAVCGQDDVGRFYCSHDELRQLHSGRARGLLFCKRDRGGLPAATADRATRALRLATMNLKPTS